MALTRNERRFPAVEPLEDRALPDAAGLSKSLYIQLLRRQGTSAEVAAWVNAGQQGATRSQVIDLFVGSTERHDVIIEEAYKDLLRRPADDVGRAFWRSALAQGMDIADLHAQVLGSAEYQSSHLSDSDFIKGLYLDVLARPTEPTGLRFWQDALTRGTTRASVAEQIVESTEHRVQVTHGLYQDLLLRDAREGEDAFWLGAFNGGMSVQAATKAFLASAEHESNLESSVASRSPTVANRPTMPLWGDPIDASFLDPTATVIRPEAITLEAGVYVAPFATLDAANGPIHIGKEADVQDNVTLAAGGEGIAIGTHVILAHGANVLGQARVGLPSGKPSFVGFNAVIDGAIVEDDAVISALARVAPGIVIRTGVKVLPGKLINTQEQADNPNLGKVAAVTAADRKFMEDVLFVNESFATNYTNLFYEEGFRALRGIGPDPAESDFHPVRRVPETGGLTVTQPDFRNRIIGNVTLADSAARLDQVLGSMDSIRADEGEPFALGTIAGMNDRVTFHALEHTGIVVGNNFRAGFHSVVHGGEDDGNEPHETTTIGDNVTVKDWGIVFRSTIGSGSTIGVRALVDGSQLEPGTIVPDRAIIVNNVNIGFVEW